MNEHLCGLFVYVEKERKEGREESIEREKKEGDEKAVEEKKKPCLAERTAMSRADWIE